MSETTTPVDALWAAACGTATRPSGGEWVDPGTQCWEMGLAH